MPIQYYIFLSLALFCIGIMGTLMRRNAIIIFMCIEMMLNAVNLALATFSRYYSRIPETVPDSILEVKEPERMQAEIAGPLRGLGQFLHR